MKDAAAGTDAGGAGGVPAGSHHLARKGLFLWAKLIIDTTDLPARCGSTCARSVAAYLTARRLERCGWNFSGVMTRSARACGASARSSPLHALLRTLTGHKPRPPMLGRRRRRVPRRRSSARPRGRLVAGAHVATALASRIDALARARGAADRRRRPRRAPAAEDVARRSRRRCTAAAARTAPSRSCCSSAVHRLAAWRLHPLHGQGRRQTRCAMRTRRRTSTPSPRPGVRAGRRRRCRRSRSAWTSRSWSSPRARAPRSACSRSAPRTCRTRPGVLLRPRRCR